MAYPDESNLTELATLKDWIGDVDNNADDVLTALINRASPFLCRYVSRDFFFSGSRSETRDGNGQNVMFMNYRPVTAVSLVKVDQTTYSPSVSGSYGYVFDSRRVVLVGDKFWWGTLNVQINYTGGVAADSPEQAIIEEACLEFCASVWKQRGREEVANRVMNGVGTETFLLGAMTDRVSQILSNVKNVVPPW